MHAPIRIGNLNMRKVVILSPSLPVPITAHKSVVIE
jgi:hypothetical protein